jgi:hypothetical protein
MQEKHQVKFLNTFCDYRQFQLKPETTNFTVGEYDNLYFIYNNLGYKIHKVGARVKKQPEVSKPVENLGIVFYFERDTNIAFQKNNANLVEKQMLDLIITDENLASFGAVIAK